MQISNSNGHAAIIATQTSRSKPSESVSTVTGRAVTGRAGEAGEQKKPSSHQNKALNNNDSDKALIYAYGIGPRQNRENNASADQRIANQSGSQTNPTALDSVRHQAQNNNIRGNLVTDKQNYVVAKAIDTYTNHQELEQSEHVSQVMGVDLYA